MGKSRIFKKLISQSMLTALFMLFFAGFSFGQGHGEHGEHATEHASVEKQEVAEAGASVTDIILHHVMDSHNWHLADIPTGGGKIFSLEIPLPWLWVTIGADSPVKFFLTSEDLENDPNFVYDHGHHTAYYVKSSTPVHPTHKEVEENPGKYVEIHGHHGEHLVYEAATNVTALDFSMTKTAFQMLLIGIIMLLVFTTVARGYKKRAGKAPKGIQSFMEPIIMFVRDEIARTYIPIKSSDKFVPYLLTLFFLIWFSNLLGMTPFNSNIAGNISVTVGLSLISFFVILISSKKDFWAHIFWFPGVPVPVKGLMFIVELMGLFTKPFALAIRLFANISAGHFMILALVSLIFIMGDNGANLAAGFGVSPLSVAFTLFIYGLETIVALVQAYVFTLLTAVFIGQAMETHDDH